MEPARHLASQQRSRLAILPRSGPEHVFERGRVQDAIEPDIEPRSAPRLRALRPPPALPEPPSEQVQHQRPVVPAGALSEPCASWTYFVRARNSDNLVLEWTI